MFFEKNKEYTIKVNYNVGMCGCRDCIFNRFAGSDSLEILSGNPESATYFNGEYIVKIKKSFSVIVYEGYLVELKKPKYNWIKMKG